MKELTIEQKAKAYDEALAKIRKGIQPLQDGSKVSGVTKGFLEEVFPELAESENEGIRKELITHCKNIRCVTEEFAERKAKWIAWLEKQGGITKLSEEEQSRFAKGVLSSCAMSFINYLDAHKYENKMCVSNGECEDIENAFHNAMWDRLHRYYCKYIEKQGEKSQAQSVMETWKAMRLEVYQQASGNRHELNYSDDTTKMFSLNDIDDIIEKISEQKAADKVEPKFHEGEWIINNESGYIRQILKINNGCYETDYGVLPIKDYESIFHLWTIQDAKEGDVLALSYSSQNYILIYKGLYKKSFKTMMSVFCFYCVEEDTFYDETDSFHIMNSGEIITPATKEQRNALMKAMADAGYTFDFESKELKEIEPISAWGKVDKDFMYDTLSNLTELKDRYGEGYGNVGKCIDWLKSLKDRVQTLAKIEKGIK